MRYAKKTRSTRGKTFKKRVAYKKTGRVSKGLNTVIKKVIRRQAETKSALSAELVYPIIANNNFMQASYNLSNGINMPQGDGDGERDGNHITVTKAVLNLSIRKNSLTSTLSKPCIVHVFIGYLKNNRGESPDSFFGNLYEAGNSSLPWNGTIIRSLRAINKKMFSVLHRYTFKVGSSNPVNYENNDFKSHYNVRIPLKELMGTVTWTNDGTTTAMNKDLWFFASYANLDDSVDNIATLQQSQVDIEFFVDIKYKDI